MFPFYIAHREKSSPQIASQSYISDWFTLAKSERESSLVIGKRGSDLNPYLDVINLSVDYIKSVSLGMSRFLSDTVKECSEEERRVINPVEKAALEVMKMHGVIMNALREEPVPGPESMWDSFHTAVTEFREVSKDVWSNATFSNFGHRDVIKTLFKKVVALRTSYFNEFFGHHIWIFFNFYRPYNPFYMREEGGLYSVRSRVQIEGAVDHECLARYITVSFILAYTFII